MTEQDEKTLAAVLERYPYDDELAGIEAGVLRRLRADLARAHAARDRAEEAELVALGYLDNATQGQTDLRASKVIDELRADLARVTEERDAAREKAMQVVESSVRLFSSASCDKHANEIKAMCFADFFARNDGVCSWCIEAQRDRAEAALRGLGTHEADGRYCFCNKTNGLHPDSHFGICDKANAVLAAAAARNAPTTGDAPYAYGDCEIPGCRGVSHKVCDDHCLRCRAVMRERYPAPTTGGG